MKRVYVAGPMTGIAERNYPAFHAEAARLRAIGLEVVNPAELNAGLEHEGWAACMRRDIVALMDCDALQLLPGWLQSDGARVEHNLARDLGIRVFSHLAPITSRWPA